MNLRVQYYDTDKMMVVYHVNYIRYFHTVRTEYFRAAGYPYSDMEKEGGLHLRPEANLLI